MSDEAASIKTNGRRRFDTDGNPRQKPEETQTVEPKAAPGNEAELEAARKRIDELARAYQALERHREDFKKRLAPEPEQTLDVERGEVALALLEAIDDLDRALAKADDSPLARGVAVIREGLLKKTEQLGIERVGMVGHRYDPNVAEAADLEVTG